MVGIPRFSVIAQVPLSRSPPLLLSASTRRSSRCLGWVLPYGVLCSQALAQQSPDCWGELLARQESQPSSKCFAGVVPARSALWTTRLCTVNINFTPWFQFWCCQVHLLFVGLWLQWCYQSALRIKIFSPGTASENNVARRTSVSLACPSCVSGVQQYIPTQGIADEHSKYIFKNFFFFKLIKPSCIFNLFPVFTMQKQCSRKCCFTLLLIADS